LDKTAVSAASLAKCILLHAYPSTTAAQLCEYKQNLHLAYWISWHNSCIFGNKLRTD